MTYGRDYVAVPSYNSSLAHHGVKGQRWGERHFQNEDGTWTPEGLRRRRVTSSKGETIELRETSKSKLAQFIGNRSSKYRDLQERSLDMNMYDTSGKRMGNLELHRESDNELNIVWISVDDAYKGKGIATAVMKDVEKMARNSGVKKLTLEVPGISPDARHIYEKQGFVSLGTISDEKDVWGGLTKMEKRLK